MTYHLVERAYDCMMCWILVGQWIVGDHDCHEAVITIISRGISINPKNDDDNSFQMNSFTNDKKKSRRDATSSKLFAPRTKNITINNESISHHNGQHRYGKKGETAVKIAAEIAMAQFVNYLGNFPAWGDNIGPSRISTQFNDDLELAKKQLSDSKEYDGISIPELVRYFLIDNRVLVGFVEIPNRLSWTINRDIRMSGSSGSSDAYATPIATETPASPVSPGTPKASMSQSYLQEQSNNMDLSPSIIIVMRDSTGKYSWTSHMIYKTPTNDSDDRRSSSSSTINKNNYDEKPSSRHAIYQENHNLRVNSFSEHQIPKVDKIFEEGSDSWKAYNAVKKLIHRQKEVEKHAIEEKREIKINNHM